MKQNMSKMCLFMTLYGVYTDVGLSLFQYRDFKVSVSSAITTYTCSQLSALTCCLTVFISCIFFSCYHTLTLICCYYTSILSVKVFALYFVAMLSVL